MVDRTGHCKILVVAQIAPSLQQLCIMSSSSSTQQSAAQKKDLNTPPTVGSDEDNAGSDLETETSGASRMSKSRTAGSRCSKRKAARRASFLAHCQAKIEASGGTFACKEKEVFMNEQRSKMLAITTEEDPDSMLSVVVAKSDLGALTLKEQVSHIKEVADNDKMSLEEKMFIKAQLDKFFSAEFVEVPKSQLSVQRTQRQFIVLKDQQHWCNLCSKWAISAHCESKEHLSKIYELAACDEMIGVANSPRRFAGTPGMVGQLSRASFRSFWGMNVDSAMPDILRDRLSKGARLCCKLGKRFTRHVTLSNLISCGMVAVSYPGTGKYGCHSTVPDRAVRWEDIEEDQGTDITAAIPQASGWWPALFVQWVEQHEDHGLATRGEYFSCVMCGTLPGYAICWYQLVDGTWELQLWPILIACRL